MSVIIRLQNLPLSAAASDVRVFFSGLKIPDGAVHIVGGPQGDVFVGFASDDDARQAMRRDRMQIHGDEIRLYLSSKNEMNDVIDKAKNGIFSQPEPSFPSSTNSTSIPPIQPQSWNQQQQQQNGNPYAARPDYTSSYPPQPIIQQPPQQQQNFQHPPPLMSQNFPSSSANLGPNLNQTQFNYPTRSPPIVEGYQARFDDNRGANGNNSRFERVRDNRGEEMAREKERQQREKERIARHRERDEKEKDRNGSGGGERRRRFEMSPIRENGNLQTKNKIVQSTAAPFAVYPPILSYPPPEIKSDEPATISENWRTGSEEKKAPLLIVQPPNIGPDGILRPGLPGQKYFIELTRLPNELLHAAKLEQFITPTIPLTLSSAKTVYGPGGVHIQTFVRLDNEEDFYRMLRRDGEMGIKIRRASKKDFDEANDGIENVLNDDRRRRRRSRSPRRRSRSRSGDSRTNRRRISPRRRRRSDSRTRREQMRNHKDPTRWCVQVTNVPFRCKEEELIEWFATKVKPAKLTRTFYSDGNASDRWIAEFSSESLFDRAFSIRTALQGRSIRLDYIENEKADEILKIEDRYGTEKRSINEAKRDALNFEPPKFFGGPAVPSKSTEGAVQVAPSARPILLPPPGSFPPPSNNGAPPRGLLPPPSGPRPLLPMPHPPRTSLPPPMPPQYITPLGGLFNNGPPRKPMPPMGRMPGGGGPPRNGGYNNGPPMRNGPPPKSHPENLIGNRKGAVLSCNGFPEQITLEEVIEIFKEFEPDTNSVLMRRNEVGKMTGECMLCCANPEKAQLAAKELNGQIVRGSKISVVLLNQ